MSISLTNICKTTFKIKGSRRVPVLFSYFCQLIRKIDIAQTQKEKMPNGKNKGKARAGSPKGNSDFPGRPSLIDGATRGID